MSSHHLFIKDLTVSYRRVPALHHINLELRCGRCVGLLGPNGAGKSTLLKCIVGLTPVRDRRRHFDAHDHGDSARTAPSPTCRSAASWTGISR